MILPVPQSPMFSMTTADTYTPISSVHNSYEIPAVYLPKIFPSTTVKIFPVSGASICLAGPHYLNQLKLTVNNLIQHQKEVKVLGGTVLLCHGWLAVKIIIGPPLNLFTSVIKFKVFVSAK